MFRKLSFILFLVMLCNNGFCQKTLLQKNYGWASLTKGGTGGDTIVVTNLNQRGKGSLFSALKLSNKKRIIVFKVAGNIDLKGELLTITNPYVTVLGQSAPSPGITLINGGIGIVTHDVIIQHIRVHTGSQVNKRSLDALSTARNAYNVIIDHCSLLWAIDENLTASGPRFNGQNPEEWRENTSHNITFSNNIIAEGLSHSIHEKGEHSMGTLIHDNVNDILIMRNLYVSNNDRNALFKGGSRTIFLNNYIYNPGIRAAWYAFSDREWNGHVKETGFLSFIGNVLRLGEDSNVDLSFLYVKNGPLKLYMNDNVAYDKNGNKTDKIYRGSKDFILNKKEYWHKDLKVLKSSDLEDYIYANVGARPYDRDYNDSRIINEVKNRNSRIINSELLIK